MQTGAGPEKELHVAFDWNFSIRIRDPQILGQALEALHDKGIDLKELKPQELRQGSELRLDASAFAHLSDSQKKVVLREFVSRGALAEESKALAERALVAVESPATWTTSAASEGSSILDSIGRANDFHLGGNGPGHERFPNSTSLDLMATQGDSSRLVDQVVVLDSGSVVVPTGIDGQRPLRPDEAKPLAKKLGDWMKTHGNFHIGHLRAQGLHVDAHKPFAQQPKVVAFLEARAAQDYKLSGVPTPGNPVESAQRASDEATAELNRILGALREAAK